VDLVSGRLPVVASSQEIRDLLHSGSPLIRRLPPPPPLGPIKFKH
jgi:hypothetical protein